jgi:hypothetical protein
VSEFFESDIVRQIMEELGDMQEKLMLQIFQVPHYSLEERKEYLQLIKDFLEKQKLLFVRMSLSDDPEAQETKEKILESARMFGLKQGQGIDEFFKSLEVPIKEIEKSLGL